MEYTRLIREEAPISYGGVHSPIQNNMKKVATPTLNISDLSYEVDEIEGAWWKRSCFDERRKKLVLRNINLSFTSGELVAVTGSSGSGKTSLLDVISGRSEGRVYGNVYFKNKICSEKVIKSCSCYVMQADRLLPNLTVRETLTYSAYLKLPGNSTVKVITEKVDKVINDLGLKVVSESRIGATINRGISGGERRRVTIAVQLLQDPQIILLDEPTTGLDSFTARYVVSNLRQLAHSGKIVIMSVHQPRYDILKLLDQVAILSNGELTYYGAETNMVPYFTNINYPCPTYANPMDIYIDVSSIDRRSMEREITSTDRVSNLVSLYKQSPGYHQMVQHITDSITVTADDVEVNIKVKGPSLGRIVYTLVSRCNINLFRDKMMFGARLGNFPLFAAFIVLFLGRLKMNQESIQDRAGLMYEAVSSPPFIAIINVVQLFPPLRDLYYRETRDGLYSIVTFILAYTLHILPGILLSSFMFSSILYWVSGLKDDVEIFLMFTAVLTIMHITGEFVTVLCLGLCHSALIANSVVSLCISMSCLISSGLLRSYDSLPEFLKILAMISMPKYAAEIVVGNEFKHLNFTCSPGEPCGYPTGEAYLDVFFKGAVGNVPRNFEILVGYFSFFFIMSMVAFKVRGLPSLQ